MNTARTVTANYTAPIIPSAYFLFASGTTHTGNLGGRAGANNICRTSTTRPAVCTAANTWAFISVSDTDEIRDFPTTVPTWTGGSAFNTATPWYWRQGAHAGIRADNNWTSLLDGSVINSGQTAGLPQNWAWTGSHVDGSVASNNTCSGWLSGDTLHPSGIVGHSWNTGSSWLHAGGFGDGVGCGGAPSHLYCACF